MTCQYERIHNGQRGTTSPCLSIKRLRQSRLRLPLTQADLSLRSGVPERQIARYERRRKLPAAIVTLLRLARALDLPMEYLISPALRIATQRDVDTKRDQNRQRQRARRR